VLALLKEPNGGVDAARHGLADPRRPSHPTVAFEKGIQRALGFWFVNMASSYPKADPCCSALSRWGMRFGGSLYMVDRHRILLSAGLARATYSSAAFRTCAANVVSSSNANWRGQREARQSETDEPNSYTYENSPEWGGRVTLSPERP
jgi:hypothetical protein